MSSFLKSTETQKSRGKLPDWQQREEHQAGPIVIIIHH